jgi:hypothetical protein
LSRAGRELFVAEVLSCLGLMSIVQLSLDDVRLEPNLTTCKPPQLLHLPRIIPSTSSDKGYPSKLGRVRSSILARTNVDQIKYPLVWSWTTKCRGRSGLLITDAQPHTTTSSEGLIWVDRVDPQTCSVERGRQQVISAAGERGGVHFF